jgi:hypothetical protein
VGPTRPSIGTVLGYLAGIAVGTTSITLLFLGMRAVMDVGGACADGGPFVTSQPCPTGTPLAMVGGMFGLFAAAGLIMWFGSRISGPATAVVALGWPLLFVSLGWNFLEYGLRPPDGEDGPIWGWLIPGLLFWIMGLAPIVIAIAAWREARAGRPGNRVSQQVVNRLRPSGASSGAGGAATPTVIAASDPDLRRMDERAYASSAFAPVYSATARSGGGDPDAAGPDDAAAADDDLAEDLETLARLHATGDLSDEEFSRAKADRLGRAGADR